jgi:GT2 family glycosyltransferase
MEYKKDLVSILYTAWNRLEFTQKSLNEIYTKTRYPLCELFVWDNNSTDGTKEYLQSISKRGDLPIQTAFLLHQENIGKNWYNRVIREHAKGEYIVLFENDILEIPEGWLKKMVDAFKATPRAGYLAANVIQDSLTSGGKVPILSVDYVETVMRLKEL